MLKASASRSCSFAVVSPLKPSVSRCCRERAHLAAARVLFTGVHPGKLQTGEELDPVGAESADASADHQRWKSPDPLVAKLIWNQVCVMLGHEHRSQIDCFASSVVNNLSFLPPSHISIFTIA